jgi:hypothetical protein
LLLSGSFVLNQESSIPSSVPVSIATSSTPVGTAVRFFNSPVGCKYSENCLFSHERQDFAINAQPNYSIRTYTSDITVTEYGEVIFLDNVLQLDEIAAPARSSLAQDPRAGLSPGTPVTFSDMVE